MRRIDLTGRVFGRLTVSRIARIDKGVIRWECQCNCGNIAIVSGGNLRTGTKSCGCLMRETTAQIHRTHGLSKTPAYRTWLAMRRRCKDPNARQYKWYGERGITVCERWESFENFLADMGDRPEGMTLERKDTAGNYEPSNCIWANQKTQMNNMRNNRLITFRGETKNLKQWSEFLSLSYFALMARLDKCGWTVEQAFTTPIMTPQESANFNKKRI